MAILTRSVGQAAEVLGVSASTIRNWIEKGYIHAFTLPSGVRRIPEEEVERLTQEFFSFPPTTVGPKKAQKLSEPPSGDGLVTGVPLGIPTKGSSDR
jgi:excisionase family DNA binding protein